MTGYKVFRNGSQIGTTSAATWFDVDTGLATGTTYTYTVSAFDAAGNNSAASSPFAVTTTGGSSGDTTPPGAPTGVFSSATTTSSVAVSWIAATDNVAIAGYRVYRNGVLVGTVASNFTFLNDVGLASGTTYTYTVAAFDAAGNSTTSSPFYVTTTGGSASTQVYLGSVYNTVGIVNDGTTFSGSGGLSGSGTALSASVLGTSQTWAGRTYNIAPAGGGNVLTAYGQSVSLPNGNYYTLSFLGFGVLGNQSGTFTVTYTDGTTQNFTQNMSDWFTPAGFAGESTALTMGHIDYASGATDTRAFHVYGYSFTLNSSKTVKLITLPNDGDIQILAMNLS